MADVVAPAPRTTVTWLDRPLLPAWQRISALAINWELAAFITITCVALALRLWDVGGRAVHHDESLHAYYAWRFFVGQGYAYDPLMHGPLQFEVVPLFYLLFGVSDASARLLAVVLGTVLVFLPYYLRSYLTRPGAVLASVMLAISPAFVYFSRFIRDDIYLACFTLVLFIALVKYLEQPRPYLLYVAAAMAALAMASMEAAYLTFFIFGSFLIVEGIREYARGGGPVLDAVRATSLDTWLTAFSIFLVINVLLYSSFFTNPYGIWDTQHPLTSPYRRDILGGLLYWKLQHSVQRGGQPWFYYMLLMPLYEQLALLFGVAGAVWACVRRSFVHTFLVWWALMAFGLYSWAGEKMPWLVIHIVLPLILLAGLFLGEVLRTRRTTVIAAVGAVFGLLFLLEVHSTFVLNYVDGANPTEMLIYVQSSNDVKQVVAETQALSRKLTHGNTMPVGLDVNDVGGWPFIWYLRDDPNINQTTTFSGPVCGGQYCPALIMLEPQYLRYQPQLMRHYVAQRYRWNWWFPEDYKLWFPEHWGTVLAGGASPLTLLGTGSDWSHIWNWLIYRKPFGDLGARYMYFLVRRDLVPGSKYFTTHPAGLAGTPATSYTSLPARVTSVLGATGAGIGNLDGPRGIATGPNGQIYVADTLNHRVDEFIGGRMVRTWGSIGTGPGQFSQTSSPMGLTVAPNGDVYVADTWNQRIQVFTGSGQYLRSWGGGPIGNGPGQFYGPRSLAISPDGKVYVADTGNRRIQIFDEQGKFLSQFGTSGTGPGQFQEPSSVAITRGGNVYVSDFWNQRIQEFSAAGRFIRMWGIADWTPQAYDEPYLAVDQVSGDVFATDPQEDRVLVFSPTGRPFGAFTAGSLSLPIGVAQLPDGQVAVDDASMNHLVVFRLRLR